MKYEQKIQISAQVKIKNITISPCIKCGCDDIKIEEYEDQYGFISTATCKNVKCNNEVKENTTEAGIIKEWNNLNNISTVINNNQKLIQKLSKEISKLNALSKKRNDKITN